MNTLKTVAVDLFDTFQAMKPAERLEILSGDEFDIVDSWLEKHLGITIHDDRSLAHRHACLTVVYDLQGPRCGICNGSLDEPSDFDEAVCNSCWEEHRKGETCSM